MNDRPKTQPEINKFRRESLIAATLRVVAECGVENTTVAKICQAAGVSRGLANHYFVSKEDLLLIAFEKLLSDLAEATARSSQMEDNPTRKLYAIVHAIFSEKVFSHTARASYLCFWTASLTNSQFAKINRASYIKYHASISRLFEKAGKDRKVKINFRKAAIGLIGMMDGLWLDLSIGVDDFTPADAISACSDYIAQALQIGVEDLALYEPVRLKKECHRNINKIKLRKDCE